MTKHQFHHDITMSLNVSTKNIIGTNTDKTPVPFANRGGAGERSGARRRCPDGRGTTTDPPLSERKGTRASPKRTTTEIAGICLGGGAAKQPNRSSAYETHVGAGFKPALPTKQPKPQNPVHPCKSPLDIQHICSILGIRSTNLLQCCADVCRPRPERPQGSREETKAKRQRQRVN